MKFSERIENEAFKKTSTMTTMQVNLGKICNLACEHCHVEASPKRTESMSQETMEHILKALEKHSFSLLDITGGAPEMHEQFVWFIQEAKKYVPKIIVRTNLVILEEQGFAHLIPFYAQNAIHLIASLPCYTQQNVDKMRGNGVFESSIRVIKQLNALGYGKEEHLCLDFIYNPGGAFLPGEQASLERDYKAMLAENFSIVFNHLFTMTNSPVGRFLHTLKHTGQHTLYMTLLEEHFNAQTLEHMMCRSQISVSYDGYLYDCDFNQMLNIKANGASTIAQLANGDSIERYVRFDEHCYACTAGAGSSCCGITA